MTDQTHADRAERDDKSLPDPAQGPAHDVPKFVELVRSERTCMLTTVAADGAIHSRPMAIQQVDDDATMWFMAYSDSAKLDQIAAHPQVNVTFGGGDAWVSASGTATLVDDDAKKRQLWNPFTEAWFGCEPEDPKVALIRVDPSGGEYWDSPSKPAQLFGVLQVLLTKTRPADGDNAKLDLD